MRETPLYQGAQVRETDRPQAQMARLSVPENPFARALPDMVTSITRGVEQYSELKDYQLKLEKAEARKLNELEFKADLKRRSDLPWGDPESVYDRNGAIRADVVQALQVSYQQKNLATAGGFRLSKYAIEDEAAIRSANTFVSFGALEMLGEQERQNLLRVGNDTFDLMDESDDVPGAFATADSMVERGLITRQRGEAMKLRVANKQALRKVEQTHSVNVGGVEYAGFDGELAAEMARDAGSGGAFSLDEGGGSFGGEATGLLPEDDGLVPDEVAFPHGDVTQEESAADAWFQRGEGPLLSKMPQRQYGMIQEALRPRCMVSVDLGADGTQRFAVAPGSDDNVVAAVGVANKRREMSPKIFAQLVAGTTLGVMAEDPAATESDVYKVLKDKVHLVSEWQGNAGEAEFRTRALIKQFLQAGGVMSGRVTTPQMQALVQAKIAELPAFAETEAGRVKALKLPLSDDGKYKKPNGDKDPQGHATWHWFFNVYKEYRDRFNPKHPEGEATREEFEDIAPFFHSWYMGAGRSPYGKAKERTHKVVETYLMGLIGLELAQSAEGVDEGSGAIRFRKDDQGRGYADELAVVKDVLARPLPDDLGGAAIEAVDEAKRRRQAELAEEWRKDAVPYFERLRSLPDKGEDKEPRGATNAQRAQEAKMERSKVQSLEWGWDTVNMSHIDGAVPSCTLPKALYDSMGTKMGLDAKTQRPFIVLGDKQILVTGYNKGRGVLLNTPAVLLVTGKPKKGERAKYRGQMQFSLIFK